MCVCVCTDMCVSVIGQAHQAHQAALRMVQIKTFEDVNKKQYLVQLRLRRPSFELGGGTWEGARAEVEGRILGIAQQLTQ